MTKTTRFFIGICALSIVMTIVLGDAQAARTKRIVSRSNPKYAALIMDAQTGRVLHEENADKVLFPASLTKMMTLFLVFEAIETGKLRLDQYMTVSANAVAQPPSKLGVRVGEPITVRQGIQALVTRSANDVAVAMAETVGGSEQNFTRMMTERAHSLGMRSSNFVNPSGLPSPHQLSSARDMAILSRALMQYFPQHYSLFKTIRFNYKGQTIETHNNLMRRFPGMDGLKTGYTYASGFNLAASAVRNNRRIIVVVFGGRSAVSRDNHVADLMNRGFAMLERDKTAVQFASTQQAATVSAPSTPAATSLALNRNASVPVKTASAQNGNWGIQVGAFANPATGQAALTSVKQRLSPILSNAQPVVVPTRTAKGTVYRARLVGLTADNAARACAQLTDCIAFSTR